MKEYLKEYMKECLKEHLKELSPSRVEMNTCLEKVRTNYFSPPYGYDTPILHDTHILHQVLQDYSKHEHH